jgi:hypothetical protein
MAEPTVNIISEITEINDLSEFMQDKELDEALLLIIKLITRPDVPSVKAPELIVQLQALSTKFAILARYYTSFEKGVDASKKKNVYYTVNTAIDKLVDSLKYSAKFGV